jgi:MFS family permease
MRFATINGRRSKICYLVANAIILPVSGWLSEVIGRKRFYMVSVAMFSVASLCCGLAPSLALLVAARALQGIGGGGMAPVEQAMLADTFPPSKRAQAFAAYGVAVIVAPALGPTIGGYITDNASWHWIFFINVPIGALSLGLVAAFVDEPPALVRERKKLGAAGCASTGSASGWWRCGSAFLKSCSTRGRRATGSIRASSSAAPRRLGLPSYAFCPGS